jgi:hypothetical protein
VNPAGAATVTAQSLAMSLTNVDIANIGNTTTQDLDRILSENPDALNASELRQLRSEVSHQSMGGKQTPAQDLPAEYQAQFDRHAINSGRTQTDRLILRTHEQYQRPRGIRATPRSHLSNEPLPATREQLPVMDVSPVRFGN